MRFLRSTSSRELWSCTSNSVPTEARKRGSGGGSPRKYDNLHPSSVRPVIEL
jgi:hypothetical protein